MIDTRGTRRSSVLALFPSFDGVGGVQRSGCIAWNAMLDGCIRFQEGRAFDLHLFRYGRTNGDTTLTSSPPETLEDSPSRVMRTIDVRSKVLAPLAALRCRTDVSAVLIWHIALLKLLPFFRFKETPRVILFLHGIEVWKRQGWLTRNLLQRVDLFLSNSDYTWERFLSLQPGLKDASHFSVHLGIGSPTQSPIGNLSSHAAVLMIGRLLRSEGYKGHREMIAAWHLVLNKRPEAELWIVGEGDLRGELVKIVDQRGLTHRVRFWGEVSDQTKDELLQKCRCFALPSRGEGFGLVYLEAMRMGRPCLVSDLDAGREVVNPPLGGLAVNPDNPVALAEAICRLLTPGPEWHQWSTQARQLYENNYTERHFRKRFLNALASLN